MFYIQTIAIPFLIAICLYFIWRPKSAESIINYGLGLVVIVFAYSLIVYQLEMADVWTTGLVFYSVNFFLIPISVVLVMLKVIALLIKQKPNNVWIFNGENSRFPSGVYKSVEKAEKWIATHKLSGILTKYPLDTGVYEWTIKNNLFAVKMKEQIQPEFIGKFSSASQDHFHYKDGIRE
jgi:hypothetical protein